MRGAQEWIESHQILTIVVGAAIFAIVGTTAMSQSAGAPQPLEANAKAGQGGSSTSLSAADAAAQFKDLMDTGEKAGLVSSYDFSNTERVIYVTDVWYSMTVAFKKDFLAKVAMLQEAISGHHYFEVRNEHSNEKVGEVTAFSGSLEVYR
jgi:hypothetical protein